eukprot:TRINITY_DN3983_c0_g3_i1.p1 TRINITY_DN3983_c0_g3~~TRINITY_DN3983_c0_g3_i1.p1  ORF type:complete len:312 (+),score=102.41 TRINITY_DN3983_c0_g3_i1:72-1007(+)
MSNHHHDEHKISKLRVPIGGILLGITSAVLFYFSIRTKKRSINMDTNCKEYNHETINQAQDGDYVSLSGIVQPLQDGKYIKTDKGINTVLNISSIVERVKVTYQDEQTIGQKTRNPRRIYTRRTETQENVVSPPYESRVNFGLFDSKTKGNIELNISTSYFDGSLITQKNPLPNNNNGNNGSNININIGGLGQESSNTPIVGEISRVVEGIWKVERYLPIDDKDNDRPRYYSTVFGYVEKHNNTVVLTDQGASSLKPCIFAQKRRNEIIEEERKTSRILHYFGLGLLVVSGVSTFFELKGGFPSEKVDRTW